VLFRVLQRNITSGMQIYARRCIMRIGKPDYGGWEVPQYALYHKLENQGNQGR